MRFEVEDHANSVAAERLLIKHRPRGDGHGSSTSCAATPERLFASSSLKFKCWPKEKPGACRTFSENSVNEIKASCRMRQDLLMRRFSFNSEWSNNVSNNAD
jgi:hypothetical protein